MHQAKAIFYLNTLSSHETDASDINALHGDTHHVRYSRPSDYGVRRQGGVYTDLRA